MSDWVRPVVAPDKQRNVSDTAPDFWIESLTAGAVDGRTFMNGQLLHGVQAVDTSTDVDGITTVTIRFVVRTLNKGDRP